MTSRNTIAICELSLEDVACGIFFPDGPNVIGSQLALTVAATAIIEWVFEKVVLSVVAESANLKILYAIVCTYTVFVVNSEIAVKGIEKREGDDAMGKGPSILALLTKNTSWIANIAWSFAQNATMQAATINASSIEASYATKIRGFVDAFVSWHWFPDFVRHDFLSFGCRC